MHVDDRTAYVSYSDYYYVHKNSRSYARNSNHFRKHKQRGHGVRCLLGTRYIVVDCGGGTVDITAHEMDSTHGELHEIFKATGGPHGSVGLVYFVSL